MGSSGDWFGDDGECLRSAEGWRSTLTRSGLSRARAEATAHGADRSIDIVARAPEAPSPSALVAGTISPAVEVLIVHDGSGPDDFAVALKQALTRHGAACRLAEGVETATSPGSASPILVWLRRGGDGDGVRRVAAQCLALKTLAIGLGSVKTRVFVPIDATDLPVAGAVASFLRTVANEMPAYSFHRVAIPGWTPEIVERLAEVILSETDETDIAIRDERVEVLRYASPDVGGAKATPGAVAWRLEKTPEGGLDRVSWNPAPRIAPKEGQIEVEVVATGLNFRDVMWALSLLPDDMLEEGFAGPTLGLEFSGRVARGRPERGDVLRRRRGRRLLRRRLQHLRDGRRRPRRRGCPPRFRARARRPFRWPS